MGTLTSLLVLSFLIFFHELGHFLAARFLHSIASVLFLWADTFK